MHFWPGDNPRGSGCHFPLPAVMGGVKACAVIVRWLLRACSDTFLGMVLGGIGGSIGAGIGFWLAYWSPVGTQLAEILSEYLSWLSPDTQLAVEPVLLLFAWAGLGTALGLTEAGSFGQLRRFWPGSRDGNLWLSLGMVGFTHHCFNAGKGGRWVNGI